MRRFDGKRSVIGEVTVLRCNVKICVFVFFLAYVFGVARTAEARDIYVRLADKPGSMNITSDGNITLIDGAQKSHGLGKNVVLSRSGNTALAGKNKYPFPIRISGTGLLGYNKRKYRGEFLITKEFVLINKLDVEDYLRGVLPAEVGAKWPMECLKVQAIISRTYGLRQSLNRSAKGYDVVDTVSDQVYRGAGVENARTDQAIRETAGEVLTYQDTLAFTPFHSDSGGYTANNAHVWGKNLSYLTEVKEPVEYRSPNSSWEAKISASQLQAALSKVGCNVGRVKEVRIADVDAGGRAKSLTFVGSSGSSSVKSSLFRTAVGSNLLKSTMLVGGIPMPDGDAAGSAVLETAEIKESNWIEASSEEKDSLPRAPVPTSNMPLSGKEEARLTQMTSDGVFNSAELMDMLMNPEKRKGYLYMGIQRGSGTAKKQPLPKPAAEGAMPALRSGHVIVEENGYFVFRGRGWGHGVGLSQWGAQALANQGWTAENILEHYYRGTVVKRFK